MVKQHGMVKILRIASVLFVLFGCLMIFVYTPFYSRFIVFLLNKFVSVEVNHVAAQSQQMAALSEGDDLEPGSDLWIARQAYLKVLQDAGQKKDVQALSQIQERYRILIAEIKQNQNNTSGELASDPIQSLIFKHKAKELPAEQDAEKTQLASEVAAFDQPDNLALMDKYTHFLNYYPIQAKANPSVITQLSQDLEDAQQNEEKTVDAVKPSAIVVLGGGLTTVKGRKGIVVNDYTRLRLETTLALEKQNHLPIVLSGVEAPYMQKWLNAHSVEAKLLENRSMNTCENTRFSSLLLQKKGGAPKVMLVTDEYHMPRTRRLFAMNGIATVPVNAPMPTALTAWQPAIQNYDHSRRANYELLATIRDTLFGAGNCREVP
ncbi:YdcF family protein [Acinetobacter sp. MD2(2019)]|uniref:YdcF family protein n=1 Tax=Acinetobacter sp. MD2(2019) TaxID=2605273 RepID=UPI002D1EA95F|nr:YdcF family protein [Acinetobacter sp. MD2(2019)]MEB3752752.1 YdcF family protein [Acinetobacter sp. MD2(2019)]